MRPSITDLAPKWRAAQRKADDHCRQVLAADSAALELYPYPPADTLCTRAGVARAWPADRVWLERNRPHALPAYDHWRAQCDAIFAAFGVEMLDHAFNAADVIAERLAERVAAIAPHNPAEAAIKFAALLRLYGDGQGGFDQPAPVIAFLGDLERLADAPALCS